MRRPFGPPSGGAVELPAGRGPVRKKRWKRTVLLAAALAALLGVSSLTVAGWTGFDFAAWITGRGR